MTTCESERIPTRRSKSWTTALLAVFLLVPSLFGFGTKFLELISLSTGESEGWFAISPVVNYLLASLGFLCLFAWAAGHGMFRNIEEPKFQMLEVEHVLDQRDANPNPRRQNSN
jgi:hypothetical protein